MSRKDFLRGFSAASALVASGLRAGPPAVAVHDNDLRAPADQTCSWILLHLAGGLDWHDIIVPLGDPAYTKLRPTLFRNSSQCIKAPNDIYINALLAPLVDFYKHGQLAFVKSIAASATTHFRAEIDLGEIICPPLFTGRRQDLSAATFDKEVYHNKSAPPPLIDWWKRAEDCSSAKRLKSAGESLRANLEEVSAGLATNDRPSIYYLRVGGFDTHYDQRARYARLLPLVAAALASFQQDLIKRGLADRMMTLGLSEFGRTLAENHQGGTEHACAGKVFFMGQPETVDGMVNSWGARKA